MFALLLLLTQPASACARYIVTDVDTNTRVLMQGRPVIARSSTSPAGPWYVGGEVLILHTNVSQSSGDCSAVTITDMDVLVTTSSAAGSWLRQLGPYTSTEIGQEEIAMCVERGMGGNFVGGLIRDDTTGTTRSAHYASMDFADSLTLGSSERDGFYFNTNYVPVGATLLARITSVTFTDGTNTVTMAVDVPGFTLTY